MEETKLNSIVKKLSSKISKRSNTIDMKRKANCKSNVDHNKTTYGEKNEGFLPSLDKVSLNTKKVKRCWQ